MTFSKNAKIVNDVKDRYKLQVSASTQNLSLGAIDFYLNEDKNTLRFFDKNRVSELVIPFDIIIGFEVKSNGTTITKGSITEPIVGALLFGGAGMITGGVIGKKTSITKQKIEALFINLNSFNTPYVNVSVPFIPANPLIILKIRLLDLKKHALG